jgi:hypothetical protein
MKKTLHKAKVLSVSAAYLFAIATGLFNPIITRADATLSYGGSTVTGIVEDTIALSGITVGGSDPTIPVILSIDDGILRMTDMTGLTFSSSTSGQTLSFSGSVADINNALSTLEYRTLTAGTKSISATILPTGLVYFPGNGHLYEVVDNGSSLSWDAAQPLAASRTLNGATGYLATVTTQAENDYLLGRLSGDGWFGASDSGTEDDWKWVTGPEAGTSFWAGLGDGAPVGGLFSNWASGEPNNSGNEDCAQFYSSGSGWNDLPCDGDYLQYYVVEYGGPGDLPTEPETVSFDVVVSEPSSVVVPISSCLDLIDVHANGTDNRYDILSLTTDIDCTGETLVPMFGQSDPDFGTIGFRGELDGQGNEITNISIDGTGSDNVGIFAFTNSADVHDIILDGSVIGQNCVGGIVGSAQNTGFDAVTSSITVSASNSGGGLVGCYESSGTYANTVSNNSVTSSITGSDSIGGLFGEYDAQDDSSTNVELNEFTGAITATGWAVGGIIGSAESEDESRSDIDTNLSGGVTSVSANAVGGIVGYIYVQNDATFDVDESSVTGNVEASDTVGGIVGEADNDNDEDEQLSISATHLNIDVTSVNGDNVGGIIGYAGDSYIHRSSFTGNVSGGDDEAGGLIGEANDSTIVESYTSGTVEADDSFSGGLVGRNSDTTILRSYSTADVSGDDRVGGLVGANGGYIIDSYARGTVTAASDEAGGLAGRCGREITNSYATGAVSGSGDVGGLVGYDDGCDIVSGFWDTESTTQPTSGGDEVGKTTLEMKNSATFLNTATVGLDAAWNFDSVWQQLASVNDGYPCLQWQDGACAGDSDADGVSAVIEDASPNSGDANNDGTPDSDQTHVSSFVSPVTSLYTAVETDASCSLAEVASETEASQSVQDAGYSYASGLVNFTADCGTPGYTTTVKVLVFGTTTSSLVLRKHNPNTNAYFTVSGATITDVVVGGQNAVQVVYQIVDGGVLDTDGTVNGTIVDPVGLASLVLGAPNTGFAR